MTEPGVAARVRANVNLRVPDIGVTCAPDVAGETLLPDPILLVEIISPGNASATWDNVWAYTSIPTVNEILILQPSRVEAELLRRQGDCSWPAETLKLGASDALALECIAFAGPLKAVHAKTYLDA